MNLDEITIEQYMKIIAINKSSISDVNKAKEILKIFDPKLKLKKSDADILINSIKEILDTDVKDFIRRFKYDGVEYGFIPNLDNITTAEFIDLSEYLKESIYLDRIAAILYRPVTQSDGELYRIEEYEGSDKYSDIMKKVDHRVVLSAMVFFSILGKSLLKHFPTYMEMMKKNMMKMEMKDIKKKLKTSRRKNNSMMSLGGTLCFWKQH